MAKIITIGRKWLSKVASAHLKYSAKIMAWLMIPSFCLYEVLFHVWAKQSLVSISVFSIVGFAGCLAAVLNILGCLLPQKARKWYTAAVTFLFAVIVMAEFFVNEAFQSYMTLQRIVTGAGGVAGGFAEVVVHQFLANWWRIVLVLLPIACMLSAKKTDALPKRYCLGKSLLAAVIFAGYAAAGLFGQFGDVQTLNRKYDFNSFIRSQGVTAATCAEFLGIGDTMDDFEIPEPAPVMETVPEETEPADPDFVAEPHVISNLDFDYLVQTQSGTPEIQKLNKYVAAQTPAMTNPYTGLFKGKNLVFITAEAFSPYIIDEKRTPTLYRLATKGIQVTDYYEPLWTGCTSGGEMVNISGLAMNCEMETYSNQKPFNTIGRLLMNEGYFSRAYHNNDMSFYNRHKTHANLGYEKFIAMGNGMEKGVENRWPQSDEDMFSFTIPDYIDQQPFSVYYMTVSGHCRYTFPGNAAARRNRDLVADTDYSEVVQSYLAANMEVEKALTLLLEKLEAAGIMDDTVIVLAPDHYPYGLEQGTTWNNKEDYLAELYGVDKVESMARDKGQLIIWSGCIEDMGLRVDAPCCSVDILPTLSNLFGVEYDSRLSVGRDLLGNEEAIALWPNYSWKTEKGQYDSEKDKFTPAEGVSVDDDYISRIDSIVHSRIRFSRSVQTMPYLGYLTDILKKGGTPVNP